MSVRLSPAPAPVRFRNFLCALALSLSGAAHADVTYTFSGLSSAFFSPAQQLFTITVPTFITADTAFLPGDLAVGSCTSSVETCTSIHFLIAPFGPSYDAIDFKTTRTTSLYFFEPGAFGAVGTYQTQVGFNTGTLTVTAVPEPQTYAMMLAGLALMGFVVRRRKRVPS
jgi:hypothetical protein